MYQIAQAIQQGNYFTERQKLMQQLWADFESACLDKKVFIWGLGNVAGIIFEQESSINIEGVIDNSSRKQGHFVSEFINCPKEIGALKVSSKEILKEYKTSQTVVVVASLVYYEDIICELEEMGITNYFSLLHMEYNRLKNHSDLIEQELNNLGTYMEDIISKYEIQNNKIFIWGVGTYGNHEKYIVEQLMKYQVDLNIILRVSNVGANLPENVKGISLGNIRQVAFELATAKIWITSGMMPEGIKKREGQVYINVKHWASITLKKFYLDSPSVRNIPGNEIWWKANADMMDFIIVGSKMDEESCRRGLSEKARMLHFGSPRSDVLFQTNNVRRRVCQFYKMDEKNPILLYAPTYRYKNIEKSEAHVFEELNLDFNLLRTTLLNRFGAEWNIVLRLHPGIKMKGKKIATKESIIDASEYEDSQELVAACDMMISDYSSIMFEPAFVKKPVFLFAPDRESYIDHEYELLIDYDSLPFPIATTNEQLAEYITNFNQRLYEMQLTDFFNKYGVQEDGHASERAAEFILQVIRGERV